MALKSTIFKAELQLADLDRSHFGDYSLTIARHPSETDERMMVRLLAFALNASETLTFGRGLSATDDEADLYDLDATGSIERWIDVGLPDEKLIRRACNRSRQVMVLSYGARAAEIWWQGVAGKVAGQKNLRILSLSPEESQALAGLAERSMRLQCTIQDGVIWLGGDNGHVELAPKLLFGSESA
ncbi:MAG: YaeQ family protein [Proteobacteria bacterium]|nr:YaeQ family protein [Pseudomonadota bacterium]